MTLGSPLAPLRLPDLDFSSFVLQRARQLPDKTALMDAVSGERLTFGDFTRTVDAVAGGLLARGLSGGDVVAVCAAAPLGPDIEQAAAERLGCIVRQGYGMTEASGPITTSLPDRIRRPKEIIKYKAYQVAPAELEAVLLGHPAVADAAVIPSPDPDSGEVPKAFVVLDARGSATADELLAFVAERVAPYKKVRRLEFVDAIPKAPTGKILRRLLVEQERAIFARSQTTS